jgi:hypothetical protein
MQSCFSVMYTREKVLKTGTVFPTSKKAHFGIPKPAPRHVMAERKSISCSVAKLLQNS